MNNSPVPVDPLSRAVITGETGHGLGVVWWPGLRDLPGRCAGDFEIAGEAEDGPAAVEAVTRLQPDVVFLDVQMPKMDGFQVAGALKAPLPEIIFVTAHDEFALKAFEANALDYLLKPYDEDRFRKVLD